MAVDKSGLPSCTAFPSEYSVAASKMIKKGTAPGADRRRHVMIASQIVTAPAIISGSANGVNCHCIKLLLEYRPGFFLKCIVAEINAHVQLFFENCGKGENIHAGPLTTSDLARKDDGR